MEKVLFLHSSSEGQTIKILNHIERDLGDQYCCEYSDIHLEPKIDFSGYDRILVGASVRYGHLNKSFINLSIVILRILSKLKSLSFVLT